MQFIPIRSPAELFAAALLGAALAHATLAQQKPQESNQSEDVVRTTTELVQTDVMVFDKQGAFIDGLKREQFELRVDKKLRTILFFEPITAGSANEEAQLAAARGGAPSPSSGQRGTVVPLDRGRTVFFYVDDLHLSPASVAHTRELLLRFIDREMGQNDEAAIATPSGQIGFLQQLTDNKTVLRRAVERLRSRPYSVGDLSRPPMSEHQALLIDQNDLDVLGFFVDEFLRDNPGTTRPMAADMIRGRARQMLAQAGRITTNTLSALEATVNSSTRLPGRKLVFMISDGFLLDTRSESFGRLRRVTNAAARAGAVIYSIDARGLIASLTDSNSDVAVDPSGRLQRASGGEIVSSQDALNALARDTGGRALFNNNDLSSGVARALKETSAYYLLAWRPESDDHRTGRSNRIEIKIMDRPSLVVRLRRGLADKESPAAIIKQKTKSPPSPEKEAEEGLRAALTSVYPVQGLPTALVVQFLNTSASGSMITVASKVATEGLTFVLNDGRPTAKVDLLATVFDTEGKVAANFQNRLTFRTKSNDPNVPRPESLGYNRQIILKPGLYQVRVAARDEGSGRTGSARQWIEIPDLTSRKLVLSSLMLGEKGPTATGLASSNAPAEQAKFSIDHRFGRASSMRFLTFVYNAARNATPGVSGPNGEGDLSSGLTNLPDVAIQIQVLRDDQPVVTTTLRKVEIHAETDLARIPYAAELPLSDLPRGRYRLLVIVIDRIGKVSATEQTAFVVD